MSAAPDPPDNVDNPASTKSGDTGDQSAREQASTMASLDSSSRTSTLGTAVGVPLPPPMMLPTVMDLLVSQSNQQQIQQLNALRLAADERRSRDALLLSLLSSSSQAEEISRRLQLQQFRQSLGISALHDPRHNHGPVLQSSLIGSTFLRPSLTPNFTTPFSVGPTAAAPANIRSVAADDSAVSVLQSAVLERAATQRQSAGAQTTQAMLKATGTPPSTTCTSPLATLDKTFPSERSSLDLTEGCNSPREAYRILKVLGSTLRSKTDRFIDVASLPEPQGPGVKRIIRGSDSFFPDQLHDMLMKVEREGVYTDVVSFMPHGRAFRVHKKDVFIKEVLPKFFGGQGKWSSFLRQLKLYGFLRVSSGKDCSAYYHELFLRDRADFLQYMRRVGTPKKGLDRRTYRLAEADDPDFYSLPPLVDNKSPK